MIIEISRGHLKVRIGDRVTTVSGEMFFPSKEELGFIVYSESINYWDAPKDKIQIHENEKKEILASITAEFKTKGRILEIE